MAIKKFKPTSPSRRQMTVTDYSGLSKVAPERSLLVSLKQNSGRNNTGKITVRPQSGVTAESTASSTSRETRPVSPPPFSPWSTIPTVPLTSALIQHEDGEKRYIIAPAGVCW